MRSGRPSARRCKRPCAESQNQLPCPEKPAEPTVRFSRQVLADFRSNVGRYAPETGGMMGSTEDTALVDLCHFDTLSRNTPGTFYYDVDSMTKVFHDWARKATALPASTTATPAAASAPSLPRYFHGADPSALL